MSLPNTSPAPPKLNNAGSRNHYQSLVPGNPFNEEPSRVAGSDESSPVNELQDIYGDRLRSYNSRKMYHSNSESNIPTRTYTPLRPNASLITNTSPFTNATLRTNNSPLTNISSLADTSMRSNAVLFGSSSNLFSAGLTSDEPASTYPRQQVQRFHQPTARKRLESQAPTPFNGSEHVDENYHLNQPLPRERLDSCAPTPFSRLEDVDEEDEEEMLLLPMTVRDTHSGNSTSSIYQRRGLFHSNSEDNVSFRPNIPSYSSNPFSAGLAPSDSASAYFGQQNLGQQPLHGYARNSTSSPAKRLQYVDEEDELNDEEEEFDEGEELDDEEMLLIRGIISKRARSPSKQMFGPRGWLDRTTVTKNKVHSKLASHGKARPKLDQYALQGSDDDKKSSEVARRKVEDLRVKDAEGREREQKSKVGTKSWYGKVKDEVSKKVHKLLSDQESSPHSNAPEVSKFAVTLNSLVQSGLYAQIELMLTVTANQFLLGEQKGSRLSLESVALTIKNWRRKGRPQVIEFQFDMMTQHDLVEMNLDTVRFFGSKQADAVALVAMMRAWKALAAEMSVRTFCAPDSVIRKHMSDAYMLLELLGAPMTTFLNFQEVQLRHLRLMAKGRKEEERTELEFGVTRPWIPPAS